MGHPDGSSIPEHRRENLEVRHGDQTGLSRSMGRLGSRWACLSKSREILEPSPQPPPSCLSSPPPPSHVPRGGWSLRIEDRFSGKSQVLPAVKL